MGADWRCAIKTALSSSLLVSVCLLSGCVSAQKVSDVVKLSPETISKFPAADTVLVPRATEARPLGGESKSGLGALALIPLAPFGFQELTPESIYFGLSEVEYDFRQDLSVIVARDLKTAGVGRVVAPGEHGSPAYGVLITLKEGIWRRYPTLYGLTFAGAIFYAFSAPLAFGSAQLEFEVVVIDPAGRQLGRETFKAEESVVQMPYASEHVFLHAVARCYEKVSPGVRQLVLKSLNR